MKRIIEVSAAMLTAVINTAVITACVIEITVMVAAGFLSRKK